MNRGRKEWTGVFLSAKTVVKLRTWVCLKIGMPINVTSCKGNVMIDQYSNSGVPYSKTNPYVEDMLKILSA